MASQADDDLVPEQTEGFKAPEKKSLAEYQKLDEEDEAMKRYKASLGITSGDFVEDKDDPRQLIIMSLGLEVEGRPDIIIDLTGKDALSQLKQKTFVIKEGCEFRMKVKFRVQREVLSGLSYVQNVKKSSIPLGQKSSEMIGSYSPNTTSKPFYEKKFNAEKAPSGMMGRGKYNATSRFVDDDKQSHLSFDWTFEIKKEFE